MEFTAKAIRVFLTVCTVGIATTASAQTNSVTLVGAITDKSGGVLAAATVTAVNRATGTAKTATSDQNGRYTILNLDPGSYDIRAEFAGFATALRRDQDLLVGETFTLDFPMQVATAQQTVEVVADTGAISPTESVVARVIETGELDNLPTISRSFADLAALSPGVQVSTSASPAGAGVGAGSNISIGAAPGYQTGYVVDGSSYEASGLGGAYINFSQDWIQEFSLVAQQAPAQYGNASGGVINAVTRSGGNEFHGRVSTYYQNAAMNATPLFLPAFAPTKPPYNLERYSGMLGGPIKKDKLFFFGGYEYFHDLNSIPVNVPAAFVGPASAPGVFPQSFQTQLVMLKIDYQANSKNKYSFRANYEKDNNQNVGIGAAGSLNHTLGNATNQTPWDFVTQFRWQRTISPTSLNDLLINYNYQITVLQCPYAKTVGNYPGAGMPGATIGGNPTGWWAQISYPTAGVVTGCNANIGTSVATPTQNAIDPAINDVYSLIRGNNELKFGVGFGVEETGSVQQRNNYNGQYSINGTAPFNPAVASTFPISDFMIFGGGNYQHNSTVGPYFSFFAQDSLKVRPNLTLNFGIRYDFNTMNTWMTHHYIDPAMGRNTVAELNPLKNDYSNLAPRFGYAWTPFRNNSRTVLRGGIGIMYDNQKTAADYIYLIDGLAVVNGGAINLNATRPSLNPYCLGYVVCGASVPAQEQQYVQQVLAYALSTYTIPTFSLGTYTFGGKTYTVPPPTLGPNGTGALAPITGGTNAVDSNLKTPGELQVSSGIGQEFSHGFSVAADYVYVKGFQQIIIRNSNISQQGTLINPLFGSISSSGNGGVFVSHSMRVKASWRDHRGDNTQLAYTLGWANDNSYGGFGINSHTTNATDPFNYGVDYGPSATDARNNLTASGILKGPFGLELSPIVRFTTGLPITATTTLTTAGCQAYYNQCYPVGYSKGSLRGADTLLVNARLAKNIRLGERRAVLVFVEAYNIINKANFGTNFQANVSSATFLQPTALSANLRQLQLGGRFDF